MAGFGSATGLVGKGGRVTAVGVMYGSPPTWTCVHVGVGEYKITHNLHRDPNTYIVIVTGATTPVPLQGTTPPSLFVYVQEQALDSFTIGIVTGPPGAPGTPVDQSFNFLCCLT